MAASINAGTHFVSFLTIIVTIFINSSRCESETTQLLTSRLNQKRFNRQSSYVQEVPFTTIIDVIAGFQPAEVRTDQVVRNLV